jgi:integrase
VVPFTEGEIEALRAAAPDWFAAALMLGLGAGLRQSEATGLTLDRIDFLHRKLTVDRQLASRRVGDMRFAPPKTKRSYRTVPLAEVVVEALARHVELYGVGDLDLVLHEPSGRRLFSRRFDNVWDELGTGSGMPAARFHDTRHTYASVLLSGGVSVAAAAEYLGHSPAMLLGTYAHLLPADHDRSRRAVEVAFSEGSRVTGVSSGV